ncbi:MBL fold metallo-hydrolase [Streptomyces sp. NPDC049954]|uniref:MBL fold metallo-hydrolase n=1 Tax=Streptomyces sp. NPDC049954 TaxID=3155779 RepID=UPI003423C3DA
MERERAVTDGGWERLAPGVARLRLPAWDCTVGLVTAGGTALLVDAGASVREGGAVRAGAQSLLGGGRVTHLALTHPHFDHVLGAGAFAGVTTYGAVGVEGLLGSPQGRAALYADAVRHGLDEDEAAQAADLARAPEHTVSGEFTLGLDGGRRVLLANVGPAHTGHDLVVVVPGAGPAAPTVVFCGDLVEESGPPQAGPDAVPARWPDALDRLLDLGGEDALYVPGHGAVVDAAFVRAQRAELDAAHGVS